MIILFWQITRRTATSTSISIPGFFRGRAELVFGDGTSPIASGQLSCSLDSIESRVYQLIREPEAFENYSKTSHFESSEAEDWFQFDKGQGTAARGK